MASFLRESKFRHIVQAPSKHENFYEQLKLFSHQIDGDGIAANSKFLGYIEASGSGSCVAVLPLGNTGKNHVPVLAPSYQQPLIRAHSQSVQDITFNPFHRNQLFTCSQDATLKLWEIPSDGYTVDSTSPILSLSASETIQFRGIAAHNSAAGIVAARGTRDIALFDAVAGSQITSVGRGLYSADIQSFCWSFDGELLAVTSKDKKLRLMDLRRSAVVAAECEAHNGVRSSKAVWLGDSPYLVTVGHNSSQERELLHWDSRNMAAHISRSRIDSSTSVPSPFFDPDTGILIISGKGDAAVRLFEVGSSGITETPQLHALANIPTGAASKGTALVPKQAYDLMGCEILRLLKLVDNAIHPVSFVAPRKERLKFQEDLYPPSYWECEPAKDASSWYAGNNTQITRTVIKPNISRNSVSMASSAAAPTVGEIEELSLVEPTEAECAAAASEFEVLRPQSQDVDAFTPRSPRAKSYGSTLKLRNMYGTESPRSGTVFNLKPNTTNADSALIACSDDYWAIPYQGSGGGPVVSQ